MRPAGVETAPTVTFGCSFSTSQSGRVSSRSGSPPGATSASRTPGPSRARIPPRKRCGAASGDRSALTRDLGEEALDALDVRRPWQALGEAARGGAETRSVGTERPRDRPADRLEVFRIVDHQAVERTVEQLRGARSPARDDGDPRRARLEDDVAEGLLPRRHAHHVGGGEERLDVGTRTGHRHASAERLGLAAVGAEALVVTDEHEDGVRQRVPPPEPEEKVESLPPEPAPDGDAEARAVGDAELVPDARAERRARGGVEALEIDAVVDDRNPLARDAVVARDLVPDPFGYREHAPVAARAELPALEPEDRAVIRTERPAAEARRPHAREVRAMRPAADAHHVLPRRAPEAHHHVPARAFDVASREPDGREPAVAARLAACERARADHPQDFGMLVHELLRESDRLLAHLRPIAGDPVGVHVVRERDTVEKDRPEAHRE